MYRARVVLKEEVTPDCIDRAAESCGWQLCNILPALMQQPAQAVFFDANRNERIHFVQDARLGVLYAQVGAEPVRQDVEQQLACHCGDGLALIAAETIAGKFRPERLRRALAVLVLHADGPSPAVAHAIDQFLNHSELAVRVAALNASAYILWPSVLRSLAGMAADDAEPQLRLAAQQLVVRAEAQQA